MADRISSPCAVELLASGKRVEDIPSLAERADFMRRMAGDDDLDRDRAIINLSRSPDSFREFFVLEQLIERKAAGTDIDLNVSSITSSFNSLLKRIADEDLDGINPYLGSASPNRFAAFLVRSAAHVARSIDPDFAPYLLESAASAVQNAIYEEMGNYRADHFDDERMAARLSAHLKQGGESPFIPAISAKSGVIAREAAENAAVLMEKFHEALPLFASGEADMGQHNNAVDEVFDRFRRNGMRQLHSIGLKTHGKNYERRFDAFVKQLSGFFANSRDALKIGARIAAGPAEDPDFRLLAHVAKKFPLPYNVPKDIEQGVSLAQAALKVSACGCDAAKLADDAMSRIDGDDVWSRIGNSNRFQVSLCASAFSQMVKNGAARERFGDEPEVDRLMERISGNSSGLHERP